MRLKKLLSETWTTTYGKYYSVEQIDKITREWHHPDNLKKQALDENTYFAVAKDQEKIVGLITLKKIDAKTAFLGRIYISHDYQGQGIGSRLLKSAANYFPSLTKLRLECEKQNNKACAFYLKQGFKITSEREELVEGIKMTSVVFEKQIE